MKFKLLYILVFCFVTTTFAQVNTEKIKFPCDCIDLVIKRSDRFIKDVSKEDSILIKDNLLQHFYIDFNLIVDYCENEFDMSGEDVDNCKKIDDFKSNRIKVDELSGQIEKDLEAYESRNLDIDAMAREFCECKDFKSVDDYDAFDDCIEAFGEKYDHIDGTEEQHEAFLKYVEDYCGGVFEESEKVKEVESEVEGVSDFELTDEMKEKVRYADLSKIDSPCSCLDQIIYGVEQSLKAFENTEKETEKEKVIDLFNEEMEVVGPYCESKFDMDNTVDMCSQYEEFRLLLEKYMKIMTSMETEEK